MTPTPALGRAVHVRAAASGFTLTPSQRAALTTLDAVLSGTDTGTDTDDTPPAGAYLYGPAGRGKTWLVDAVTASLGEARVTRTHLHAFLAELGPALFRRRAAGDADAAAAALRDVIGSPEVFVLDEFHTHDSGDARLLSLVLGGLRHAGVTVIATSNYAPDALLEDSPWAHRMAEAIDIITRTYSVIPVDDGVDHRLGSSPGTRFASGTWSVGTGTSTGSAVIESAGRSFPAVALTPVLTFTFAQLCDEATAPMDIAAWASEHDHWRIEDVPALASATPSAQQRFVTLIDILADADVRLDLVTRVSREDFRARAGSRPDVFRTLSRLALLRDGVT